MKIELKASSFHFERGPFSDGHFQEVESWLGQKEKRFSGKRRTEWLSGRYCAKKAMAKIGVQLEGLPSLPSRAPYWPYEASGSISHTNGFAIALATKRAKALGVDCEKLIPADKLERLKDAFILSSEKKLVKLAPEVAPTLIFSAKEALYKNLHPQTGVFMDFSDAMMREFNDNFFLIDMIGNKPGLEAYRKTYQGGWTLDNDVLITWIETV